MRYRKKPLVIDAEQFQGVGHEPYPPGICFCVADPAGTVEGSPHAHVHTIEGVLKASVDDWIITGVKGERYPCKPDVFAATYEPVE